MSTLQLTDALVVSFAAAMLVPATLIARAASDLGAIRRAIRERRARRRRAD